MRFDIASLNLAESKFGQILRYIDIDSCQLAKQLGLPSVALQGPISCGFCELTNGRTADKRSNRRISTPQFQRPMPHRHIDYKMLFVMNMNRPSPSPSAEKEKKKEKRKEKEEKEKRKNIQES